MNIKEVEALSLKEYESGARKKNRRTRVGLEVVSVI
jgi:hypothetical protein